MRACLTALLLLSAPLLLAQKPHLDVPPKGSPERVQLFGTVSDSLTGKPVYDCLVGYYSPDGVRKAVAPTNSLGRYALFVPAGMPFELRVEKEDGYLPMGHQIPAIAPGTPQFHQDLLLQPQ